MKVSKGTEGTTTSLLSIFYPVKFKVQNILEH